MLKRILIATSSPPDRGSGISTYSRELSAELCRQGIKVFYASPFPQKYNWFHNWNITHFPIDPKANQKQTAVNLIKFINDNRIDGVINNDNSTLQSIAPVLKCPAIAIGHIDKYAIAKVVSYNAQWFDYIVAISNDMQHNYVNRFGIPLHKCPIVHNGIADPGEPDPRPYDGNRKLRVICVSEYSKRKGSDLLLRAIRTSHPVWSRIDLNWFVNIPKKLIKAHTNPAVKIHGWIPQPKILTEFQNADIFLLASRSEGCPMALIEAMGHGLVPIASNGVGAMRWMITSGYEGYICHLQNWPSQMLDCLETLVLNPDLYKSMRRRVRKRFLAEFTVTRVANRLTTLLQSPTVQRPDGDGSINILKWHRNYPDIQKPSLIERLCFRYGVLRYDGWINR